MKPKLVIGANGFLGSHVTRQLVAGGADVRVLVRPTANTRGIDDLSVERFHGDLFETETLRRAMDGCDVVYHCAVDTRAWLRDPAPLFRANVEGLRNVLDVARSRDLCRFVFTSSYVTIGRRRGRRATEDDKYTWRRSHGPYPLSRLQAEELVLRYAAECGLPAVAMCVSTTYGAGDWGGTPHGSFIAGAVFGKLPFNMAGIELEVVGVDDAARALILAAERGRTGQRYIISEKMMPLTEVVRIAADEAGMPPPRRSIPLPLLYGLGALGTVKARFSSSGGEQLSLKSVRMMRMESEVDHGKAIRELGWHPEPVEDSIRAAARFWLEIAKASRKSKAAQPD
ncbi:NAD-dependent epimerase/dehydratase family protein [Mycobacterium sp.]|jgi:dihydroflavonol-4-reductase|uniref:NAD-dependent epimerase/dehydratase family protein n=1 Tax=Mycobacterium sp. TaxID=1785 RepID=UPI002D5A42A7|nr:NAD-dependent epimerase/dehydratase family protein [Mycobacterium sp.]HZA12495.1 NAD-dependent epimerase/dehydratase family protein [Mycobacterium sp.]